MMQTLTTVVALIVAIGYIGWRVRQIWVNRHNPCYGCDGCTLKKQVCDKKTNEKFGQSK